MKSWKNTILFYLALLVIRLSCLLTVVVRSNEKFVSQSVTPYVKKKPAYSREDDFNPVVCYHICMGFNMNNKSDSFSVSMSDTFWGAAFTDHVGIENIREVLKLSWLSATSISLYIKYLCNVYLVHEEDNAECSTRNQLPSRYSFTSPHIVEGHTHILDALQKHEGQYHLVMIPYNIEHHWVLVAINTMDENIYYVDLLRVHHPHAGRECLVHLINK
ncbi:hypothetical protein LIER_10105 [Lithospermum erythrorhizon]|uniref:Ubiquitin-like protease family profile domain-containing protein n=1 Tax=Lithospermum erythrorhizon TaxID=34254 RepID=A0AAV3PJE4_LITER